MTTSPTRGWLRARSYVVTVSIAVIIITTAWITRVYEGRRALEACASAEARGDRIESIVFARAAAEARCPWCSAPDLGYTKLYAIAKEAESRGDDANAVAAWRAVRAAALGSVVLDRTPPRREHADVEIARLEHRIDLAQAAHGGTVSPAASEERLRVALAVSAIPSAMVFVLLTMGGALFLLGALRFVRAKSLNFVELATSAAGGVLAAVGVLLF